MCRKEKGNHGGRAGTPGVAWSLVRCQKRLQYGKLICWLAFVLFLDFTLELSVTLRSLFAILPRVGHLRRGDLSLRFFL